VGLKDIVRRFREKYRQPSSPEIPLAEQVHGILLPVRAIIKGYTEALYPDFKVFGREMLANAIDAYRWAIYNFKQKASNTQELEDKHGTELRMDLHICAANKMVFEDYGCGMPADVIKNNYWAVRQSGKNTPEAKAAGLIGRFGIGALAMLELCMKTTTRNVFDNKTFVTEMDMTQEDPVWKIDEITATADETLAHAGTRIEATLKDLWTGTKAEWEQLSEKEQVESGASYGAKHLTPSGEHSVTVFVKLMFESMKYTGACVNVVIHASMVPKQDELDAFVHEIGASCELKKREDGSVEVKLKGQIMDVSERLLHAPEQAVETSISSPEEGAHVQECREAELELQVKYTLEARHHGQSHQSPEPCAYVLVKAAEGSKMPIKGKVYLAPVTGPMANKTEVRIFSGGYYNLTMNQVGGRCPAVALRGELDIFGLQPTAARDALKHAHSTVVQSILLQVVEALFQLLRKRGRAIGRMAVEGIERPYRSMCDRWDPAAIDFFRVPCEQRFDHGLQAQELELRHIILKGKNQELEKLPEKHFFVPAERIYYCTKWQPLMAKIPKAHTLVRLDKIDDSRFRAEVQKYLDRRFDTHLENISGWTYKNWYEPDHIDINMSDKPK
jgi:hypothetical protein